ncbi:aldose epimerase family protein [Pseudomonas sp. KNUC1026]|uniref:aldose epimerase family protein n=1 Tax=Pseudomonas sp. KNUC1026 TaxID=2893890 RepID=UPI003FA6D6FD
MHHISRLGGLLMATALTGLAGSAQAALSSQHSAFGTLKDGSAVERYDLRNSHGMQATVITYGAVLQALKVPDRNGQLADVVLGFDDAQSYQENGDVHFGATIGRFGNRLAGGKFSLDGKTYQVPLNDGPNALHGGPMGFDHQLWSAKPAQGPGWVGVTLSYRSVDGEMGFPGNMDVEVTYSLNEQNELRIQYQAHTDKPTVLNLTNHSYFNLAGAGNGDVLNQVAQLNASRYTPINATLIPTGELAKVAGTPMDFTQPTAFGKHIRENHPQLKFAEPKQGGFDFNWVLDTAGDVHKLAAEVTDPASGRRLQMFTSEPGVQLYTGNFLTGSIKGKGGQVYPHWGAFTLETQHYPDSPNQKNFPSTRLDPGQVYKQDTVFKFSAM